MHIAPSVADTPDNGSNPTIFPRAALPTQDDLLETQLDKMIARRLRTRSLALAKPCSPQPPRGQPQPQPRETDVAPMPAAHSRGELVPLPREHDSPNAAEELPMSTLAARRKERLRSRRERWKAGICELDSGGSAMAEFIYLQRQYPDLCATHCTKRSQPAAYSLASCPSFQRAGYAVISPGDDLAFLGSVQSATQNLEGGPQVRTLSSGRRSAVIRDAREAAAQPFSQDLWRRCAVIAAESWHQVIVGMQWSHAGLPALESPAVPEVPGPHLLRIAHTPAGRGNHLNEHADMGLLTVIAGTGPGLEVYDSTRGWVDVGRETHPGDVVVMAGETLHYMSNGALPACLHRVVGGSAPRMSAVFNLRAPGGMIFDSAALTTAQTGPFPTPFRHTMHAFAVRHLAGRGNVNEEPMN